ncbi:putative dehydrogenase [Paraburkholderia sp. CI2]|nr:putative dehydrogenase [Paraburkholderia sp. CI2]
MNRTRIAVAGAGYIGRVHLAVAQQSDACTLSAIVDPSPAAEAGVPLWSKDRVAASAWTTICSGCAAVSAAG